MSLERKDVRFKLDPDWHSALSELAQIAGVDINDLCETVITEYIRRRVHEANLVAERTRRLGISGIGRENDPDATQPMSRSR